MALFAVSSSRSQSHNLLEFRAGKMNVRADNVVHPDKRKGLVYIHQAEDSLMHFCWKDRSTGVLEEDLIIFPEDALFVRVGQCTTGRVFLLKLKPTNRKYFFWMQEPKSDKDEVFCTKVNDLLNHPPPPGSSRIGRGGSVAEGGSIADQLGLDGEMLQSALGGMDQNQLYQLLNLMGAGSGGSGLDPSMLFGGITGGTGSSSSSRAATSSNITATPNASASASLPSTPAVTTTPSGQLKGSTGANSSAVAQNTGTTVSTGAAAAPVQLADLQSILSSINIPSTAADDADVQSFAELLEKAEKTKNKKEKESDSTVQSSSGESSEEKDDSSAKKDKEDEEGMDLD